MDDATELAVRRARDQYPMGDAELAGELGAGSPDTVARIMQRTHEAAVQARQQGQPPAGAPVPGGIPIPADNATRAAESAEQRELRQAQYDVRWRGGRSSIPGGPPVVKGQKHHGPRTRMSPDDAREAQWAFFTRSWNTHMGRLNRVFGDGGGRAAAGMSDVSSPPRFIAPAGLPLPGDARI
jgi:hypothetical protein